MKKILAAIISSTIILSAISPLTVMASPTTIQTSINKNLTATVDSDEMNVKIDYNNSNAYSDLKAAVWTSDDQKDLIWYNLQNDGEKATTIIPITSFKASGKYNVHLYNGSTLLDNTTFTIHPLTATGLRISGIDGTMGIFSTTLKGISSSSGISAVSISAWPNSDPSKTFTYTAEKAGDDYIADIDVANHGRIFGKYTVNVYATGNNGVTTCVKRGTTTITADKYLYCESTGDYTERVWIINPGSNVTKVQFPTWSEEGNQDDLIWYDGVQSDNAWYADIDSSAHKHSGTYVTHCYITKSEQEAQYIDSLVYKLDRKVPENNTDANQGVNSANEQENSQAMLNIAQDISSPTEYLILINRGLHRVGIYQGSQNNWSEIKYWPCVVGKPSTPTPTGTFHIKGRFSWFGDGHKSWWATQIDGYYYFHSQIYYWDDAPNEILDPTMDAEASAGCVRLYVDNAYWIYTTIPRDTTVYIYN